MMGDGEDVDFEGALSRLEDLVGELERGELNLENSLRRFEEGVRLVRRCSEQLKSAELRIRQLEEGTDGVSERAVDVAREE
ncbi:MAG: exodeoxyribonuclease VII small subunit [Deltaproteobacteria bacterium]|nr:exodeoxyribonuclease VII small subunit [Deltaproteobacteria bacterium]TDI98962.1 MAG: exodeoxyribonuclease VII small subunit [Deltaproteobacteria bacterium]